MRFRTGYPCVVKMMVFCFFLSGCLHSIPRNPLTPEQEAILQDLVKIMDMTIAQIDEKLKHQPDPTSPLHEFSSKIGEKKKLLEKIQGGQHPFNASEIRHIHDEVAQIRMNITYPANTILEADVSFRLGKYKISDLSEQGRSILDAFARDLVHSLLEKSRATFPDKSFKIRIRTIGYADEAMPGDKLIRELIQNSNGNIPKDPIARRKFLNRELSTQRAQAIAKYLQNQLEAQLKSTSSKVTIGRSETIGLGEALPYPAESVDPPYSPIDPRRRICKVHGNVFLDE